MFLLFIFGLKYSQKKRFGHTNGFPCWLCQVGHLIDAQEKCSGLWLHAAGLNRPGQNHSDGRVRLLQDERKCAWN